MGLSSKRRVLDGDYFLKRAEAEVRLADKAGSAHAAAMHQKLASAYFDKLFADGAAGSRQMDPAQVQVEKRAALASLFSWPQREGDGEHLVLSELLEELDSKLQTG